MAPSLSLKSATFFFVFRLFTSIVYDVRTGIGCKAVQYNFFHLPVFSLLPSRCWQYYNFSAFALSLNEMLPGMEDTIYPTDARLRPDIRHLEHGRLDEAGAEKHRLEEKQRESRKARKKLKGKQAEWNPRWRTSIYKPLTLFFLFFFGQSSNIEPFAISFWNSRANPWISAIASRKLWLISCKIHSFFGWILCQKWTERA